ncbi:MAG: carboxymuconolactone decarboxylase family protein [Synechococcales cyanobacterium]
MSSTYPDQIQLALTQMGHLARESPDVMRGFNTLHRAATAAGVLDTKTKELIALAIAVATHCEGCIGFHVKAALGSGATRQEILELLGVTILMGGGPALIYATHVLEALEQLQPPAASDSV